MLNILRFFRFYKKIVEKKELENWNLKWNIWTKIDKIFHSLRLEDTVRPLLLSNAWKRLQRKLLKRGFHSTFLRLLRFQLMHATVYSYVHLKKSEKKSRYFFGFFSGFSSGYFFGYFFHFYYIFLYRKKIQKNPDFFM